MKFKIIRLIEEFSSTFYAYITAVRKSLSLSKTEFYGILAFGNDRLISCKEHSIRMGISISRGSRIIASLAQKGIISQIQDQNDKRCKLISLTSLGEEHKKQLETLLKNKEKEIESSLTNHELQNIVEQFHHLSSLFSD